MFTKPTYLEFFVDPPELTCGIWLEFREDR